MSTADVNKNVRSGGEGAGAGAGASAAGGKDAKGKGAAAAAAKDALKKDAKGASGAASKDTSKGGSKAESKPAGGASKGAPPVDSKAKAAVTDAAKAPASKSPSGAPKDPKAAVGSTAKAPDGGASKVKNGVAGKAPPSGIASAGAKSPTAATSRIKSPAPTSGPGPGTVVKSPSKSPVDAPGGKTIGKSSAAGGAKASGTAAKTAGDTKEKSAPVKSGVVKADTEVSLGSSGVKTTIASSSAEKKDKPLLGSKEDASKTTVPALKSPARTTADTATKSTTSTTGAKTTTPSAQLKSGADESKVKMGDGPPTGAASTTSSSTVVSTPAKSTLATGSVKTPAVSSKKTIGTGSTASICPVSVSDGGSKTTMSLSGIKPVDTSGFTSPATSSGSKIPDKMSTTQSKGTAGTVSSVSVVPGSSPAEGSKGTPLSGGIHPAEPASVTKSYPETTGAKISDTTSSVGSVTTTIAGGKGSSSAGGLKSPSPTTTTIATKSPDTAAVSKPSGTSSSILSKTTSGIGSAVSSAPIASRSATSKPTFTTSGDRSAVTTVTSSAAITGPTGTRSQDITTGTKSPIVTTTVKTPTSSVGIKSPIETAAMKSPVVTSAIKTPDTTKGVKSPSGSITMKSPDTIVGVKSSTVATEVKSPIETAAIKSPVASAAIKTPDTTKGVKIPSGTSAMSPDTIVGVKSPIVATERKSPIETAAMKSPVVSSAIKIPDTTKGVKSPSGTVTMKSLDTIVGVKGPIVSTETKSPVVPSGIKSPDATSTISVGIKVATPSATKTATTIKSPDAIIGMKSPIVSTAMKSPIVSTSVKTPEAAIAVKAAGTGIQSKEQPGKGSFIPTIPTSTVIFSGVKLVTSGSKTPETTTPPGVVNGVKTPKSSDPAVITVGIKLPDSSFKAPSTTASLITTASGTSVVTSAVKSPVASTEVKITIEPTAAKRGAAGSAVGGGGGGSGGGEEEDVAMETTKMRPYLDIWDNDDKVSVANSQAPLNGDDGTSHGSGLTEAEPERGNWTGRFDFLLSLLGYSVGLGNVWRFPYLCYNNGGGAFLIPFTIMLVIAGLPLMFMELSFGQYASLGPVAIYKRFCPLFRGLGYGMIIVSAIVMLYYNLIIAWTIFYMFASLSSVLPWQNCEPQWKSKYCFSYENADKCSGENGTYYMQKCYNATEAQVQNITLMVESEKRHPPAEDYFANYVLGLSSGIEETGQIRPSMASCLLAAWVIVFLCLCKGVQSSGKVVYFTALFPYVVLVILFFRGVTLPGASTGILFYLTPDWQRLTNAAVWGDAAVQIFFALSPAWGGLITLASYNKFSNDCYKDSLIVAVSNIGTSFFAGLVIFSVIGFLAHELNVEVTKVLDQGAGLAFIVYPEVVTRLPVSPVWSLLFFVMLLTLGLDSQFALMETVTTALLDRFPNLREHKICVVLCVAIFGYFGGLIFTTNSGMYWLQLVDKYAANWSVLLIAISECILISWVYGADRFLNDIQEMIGKRSRCWMFFWTWMWKILTPSALLFILFFNWIEYAPVKYGDYIYPKWADVVGWVIGVFPILVIVVMGITKYFSLPQGTFQERIKLLLQPTAEWGPASRRSNNPLPTYDSVRNTIVMVNGLPIIQETRADSESMEDNRL